MLTYKYYYLPKIIHYDESDKIKLTVHGDVNKEFMRFDQSMHKFIFYGITIGNVGEYKILVTL